jgi:hypothetical protein
MVFSFIMNPVLAASASAPIVKPPSISIPGANTPVVKPPVTAPLKKLEAPARVQGVNYEFKDEIKKIPASMQYDFKALSLDKFASFETETKAPSIPARPGISLPNVGIPGGTASQSNTGTQDEDGLDLDKINGIRYPAGSKLLEIPQSAASSFTPKTNEIYIDEEEGTAFKILGTESADDSGNSQYVVGTPELTEIFKSYTIPEQTLDLTTGNIAYIDPDFELSPDSGMSRNYTAKAGPFDDIISFTQEGNKHILTLKQGVTIFKYPFQEQQISDKEAAEQAKKEKFDGDWWEKDQSTDLRGVENESELSVEVKVKEGKITIEDPKFHAYFDLNPWTSHVVADFYFDAKAEADVTLEGDITFNKTIEKCVYGYEIDLGKVMGKEKANKAFVGIFIVIGVQGQIHVEVRTITTGDARAGFTYRAIGYGGIPYFAGPYAIYRPSTFDMSFTVNGEINTTLACVPQVGVIIWGKELGVLQIWVGFKSKAVFSVSGGGGSGGSQGVEASGSIDLRAFGELVGFLLGSRYSIFYIEFPLYYGEWSVGEEASGSGGDAVREVLPYVRVTADAYSNKVEGKVAFSTAGKSETGYIGGDDAALDSALKPYANSLIALEVYDRDSNIKFSKALQTDGEGNFSEQFTGIGIANILPSDKVCVNVQEHMSPEFEADNNKYKVVGTSPKINATVPFSDADLNLDTFNDVITGWVSGDYTGPVEVKIMEGTLNKTITANAVDGLFKVEYPITESTAWATANVNFEGSSFPRFAQLRYPNLDALTINIFNDFNKPAEAVSESGIKTTVTIPGGVNPGVNLPDSITSSQGKLGNLTSQDIAGNEIIKPTKIIGTITNKGDMGWLENQGDDKIRPSDKIGQGNENGNFRPYEGNVKITELYVQSALEAALEDLKGPHDNWLPKPQTDPVYTATTQARQAIGKKVIKDSSSPSGIRIESYPTSAAEFEFNQPDVAAYIIEIEYEGLKLERIYNPFEYHYNNNQQSLNDFLGPLREQFVSPAQEEIDSVTNPADVMNQWEGSWMTNVGAMNLSQKGTSVTGTIMKDGKTMTVEGTVTDGVFKGSILVPSTSSIFGDIISIEMNISSDGRSINFRNIGTETEMRGLNGTRAIRQ